MKLFRSERLQTGADLAREEDDYTFYGKAPFHHLLRIERHRTERSGKPFLLLLLDISALMVERREWGGAIGYAGLSAILSVAAVFAGLWLARRAFA